MSGFTSFGGSVANRANPGYEAVGVTDTSTGLVLLTASASTNTKGSYANLGTASGALWKGIWVYLGVNSATGAQFLIDISVDGGTTVKIPNLYCKSGTSSAGISLYLPLNVQTTATANDVRARCQSTVGSATVQVAVMGVLNNDSNSPPLWDNMSAETMQTASTALAPNACTVGTGAGAYVQLDASASQNFGAILPVAGNFSATAAEEVVCTLATGASGAETAILVFPAVRSSLNPTCNNQYGPLIYTTIASATETRGKMNSVAGAGTGHIGWYGFY